MYVTSTFVRVQHVRRLSCSWDDDRGGTLDLKELGVALQGCQAQARQWRQEQTLNPALSRATVLRDRARFYDEAAKATLEAEGMEAQLKELEASLEARTDIKLGYLLSMRRIKPGAVVTTWAKSRGEHAGELSRAEFRHQCQQLRLHQSGNRPTSGEEIDAIFDEYDSDKGGYMDQEEAKEMVLISPPLPPCGTYLPHPATLQLHPTLDLWPRRRHCPIPTPGPCTSTLPQ